MRKLSKNYSLLGNRMIIVRDIPAFDAQDIRLVVNETQGEVLVSSLNKAGVTVALNMELPDASIAPAVITLPSSVPAIASGDILTIEIEQDTVAKEETLRDFVQMIISHMHTGVRVMHSCAQVDNEWYFFTGRRSPKGHYIWRSFNPAADHPYMYYASPDLDMDEGGATMYADDELTDEFRVSEARNDLFATKQDLSSVARNGEYNTKLNEISRAVGGYSAAAIEQAAEKLNGEVEGLSDNVAGWADSQEQLVHDYNKAVDAIKTMADSIGDLGSRIQPGNMRAMTEAEVVAMVTSVTVGDLTE